MKPPKMKQDRAIKPLLPRLFATLTLLYAADQTVLAAQPGKLAQGHQVFDKWCLPCHGSGADFPGTVALATLYKGAKPALLQERSDLSPTIVKHFVRQGVSIMPSFRKTEISDAELDALATYLAAGKHQAALD